MACPRIEQAGLKARGKVMASTGANTNGMLLAAVALAGIGWSVLDMRRLRMDVTVRHGTRRPEKTSAQSAGGASLRRAWKEPSAPNAPPARS